MDRIILSLKPKAYQIGRLFFLHYLVKYFNQLYTVAMFIVYTYKDIFICLVVYMNMYLYVQLCICSIVHIFNCSYEYVFIYSCIHIYIYSYVQLCICSIITYVYIFICNFYEQRDAPHVGIFTPY
jgi:hypothetical protein